MYTVSQLLININTVGQLLLLNNQPRNIVVWISEVTNAIISIQNYDYSRLTVI
jgi:hypothetical protein